MKKRDLPKLSLPASIAGLSWEPPASALARWNAALAAKEEEDEEDNTISMYDPIGFDPWTGGGVTAKRIDAALRKIGRDKDVVVNLNSPGGDLFEGIAIYNLLREHKGKVTIRIVGLAASAASLIAMAGDEVEIGRASFMMIHNVWVVAIGNRNDLRDAADQLETFDDALSSIYAAHTGMEKSRVAKLMDKETWFSGDQAVEDGFADSLLPADRVEEREEGGEKNAVRALDLALARAGVPRKERRAMINEVKGQETVIRLDGEEFSAEQVRQLVAQLNKDGTRDAPARHDLGTLDAAGKATLDAGEGSQVIAGMLDFLSNFNIRSTQ